MLASENEAGHVCPISMTYSAVPVLRNDPALAAEWEPRIHSTSYDPSFRPAPQKAGVLMGMAMTEKQGGSDVRANTTRAGPIGHGAYVVDGHKWFCPAPCAMRFWRRRPAARRAFSCRVGHPTISPTAFICSG